MALKITLSASVLLLIFREKKASFNSFVVRCLSCKVVLIFFTKLSKTLLGREIFLSRDYSISVKNPLGFLAISFPKVIYFLSTISLCLVHATPCFLGVFWLFFFYKIFNSVINNMIFFQEQIISISVISSNNPFLFVKVMHNLHKWNYFIKFYKSKYFCMIFHPI